MVDVQAFSCVRPRVDMVHEVASLPYDVFSLDEARREIAAHPHSFLRIDMTEATFSQPIDHNDDAVFKKAHELLEEDIKTGTYLIDPTKSYYLYRLCAPNGTAQTGIVACASVEDYRAGRIKKHEKTRAEKEYNRIRHVDELNAQTGPIFLAFRSEGRVERVMEKVTATPPLYDFTADDGVRHSVWHVSDTEDAAALKQAFAETDALYIADGHHRAASAVKAGILRREKAEQQAQKDGSALPGVLESDHFLSVLFPSDQLTILDYNRVASDRNGLSEEELIERVREHFTVRGPCSDPYKPQEKTYFGMYVAGSWYQLAIKDCYTSSDPVSGLDVSLLQDYLLAPILGIEDPRTDSRIDFVGGIRGLKELEKRADEHDGVAFALFPTSIEELFAVADADLLMPPKSTWFEPKLRSGIFIHQI